MQSIKTSLACFAAIALILFCGCTKYEKPGHVDKPGIVLTFDDHYVDDWYQYRNLFDSFGVKVTFYVSNYRNFTPEQKDKLHELQRRGHEIAFHSTTHANFAKYAKENKIAELMKEEVEKGMELMQKDGFYPTTFAYPYGKHTEILDNAMLRKFKSVRALNGSKNYAKSFTAKCNASVLYAIGLDQTSGKSTEEIINLVNLAKINNNCLVMVAHHIETPNNRMCVTYQRLKQIFQKAKELDMTFYTASQVSRK
jgi:peptidoglycan/xylan/chitin deacetylase (PgdA/CDA1 family)